MEYSDYTRERNRLQNQLRRKQEALGEFDGWLQAATEEKEELRRSAFQMQLVFTAYRGENHREYHSIKADDIPSDILEHYRGWLKDQVDAAEADIQKHDKAYANFILSAVEEAS